MLEVVRLGMKMHIFSNASCSTFNQRKSLYVWVSIVRLLIAWSCDSL